jgi:rubredoxin-NAD+ reductase
VSERRPLVIVGTGLAGYTLAREWRKLERERPLVMLTADDGSFYSKPMLSNALAQGKTPNALAMKSAEAMAAELKGDIRTGVRVEEVDAQARRVMVDGNPLAYGELVLAVGAEPIRIPTAGNGTGAVLAVNSLADYRRFRERLQGVTSVAIMGPGLIGCEFANDLSARGVGVDVYGPDLWPLSTLLPRAAGRALLAALAREGIRFHLGTVAERIDEANGGLRVTLKNGERIDADLVLSAIGLRPETNLAAAAGLAVSRGIATNRCLQTSDPHIFALGDCAEVDGFNLPYVMPIMHGARALSKTLAGEPTEVAYPPMPVVIKTPALATVVCPPPRGADGEWHIKGTGIDVHATFLAPDGTLLGFALTGDAAKEKQALLRQLPPVL